jgi:hypothetical protein
LHTDVVAEDEDESIALNWPAALMYLPAGQPEQADLVRVQEKLGLELVRRLRSSTAVHLVYLPAGQSMHATWALAGAYWPSAQSLHTDLGVEDEDESSVSNWPAALMYLPAGQPEQAALVHVQEKLGLVYLARRLRSSPVHLVYLPAGQSAHAVLPLMQNRPLVHEEQERPPAAEAATVMYWPPGQVAQVHVALLRYWPGGHAREQGIVVALELLLTTTDFWPASTSRPAGQLAQDAYVHE